MNDKMIIDFINNVEPDMTYGSSDGMTRAMVESAENMALINEYIVESTYEVYSESEDGNKESIIAKIKNKIHKAFILFVNLIKKAIEKVKGYFYTIKTKLTAAMAKTTKRLGIEVQDDAMNFSIKNYNNHLYIGEFYVFDDAKVTSITKIINQVNTALDDRRYSIDNIEDAKKAFLKDYTGDPNGTGSVFLIKQKLVKNELSINDVVAFFDSIYKDIDETIKNYYNTTMKSYTDLLNRLQVYEKITKEKCTDLHILSNSLKWVNKVIHVSNFIRYKGIQLVLSACIKAANRAMLVWTRYKNNLNK